MKKRNLKQLEIDWETAKWDAEREQEWKTVKNTSGLNPEPERIDNSLAGDPHQAKESPAGSKYNHILKNHNK